MSEQAQCSECGVRILTVTAEENGGLCIPCARGTRSQIEEGRRRYQEDKAFRQSPVWLFWVRLVKTPDEDFSALSDEERQYYAVGCLRGDVINGGFRSYFWNTSPDLVSPAVEGLKAMGAEQSLAIFDEAIAMLPDGARDTARSDALRRFLDDREHAQRMDALDRRFWSDSDDLWALMIAFGVRHGFYPQPDAV